MKFLTKLEGREGGWSEGPVGGRGRELRWLQKVELLKSVEQDGPRHFGPVICLPETSTILLGVSGFLIHLLQD